MAAGIVRRSVATATLAALATALAPMAASLAAPGAFAASSITTQPSPENNVVWANRPIIKATFNANLASGTINLTAEGGDGANLCAAQSVSNSTITCQPGSELDKTKTYDAVATGKNSAGASAKTSTLKFTVSYPVLDPANSSPIPNGSFVDGSQNLVAAFDSTITGDSNSFKLFEVNADGSRGFQIPGAVSFDTTPVVGANKTVTFNPNSTLANGHYEAVVSVIGLNGTTKEPDAHGNADYSVFITNTAPFGLNLPVPNYNGKPYANTSNNTAFPFSGYAAPGLTVTVNLTDTKNPNPLTNAYKGSATVAPCPTAPACPWTVPVDISKLTNPQDGVQWTATAADSSKSTGATNGPVFSADYTAPPTVTVNPAPKISQDSKTVSVNAQDTATDVASYLVTITDPENNKLSNSYPASNNNLPPQTIDVTTLDDGTLNITIQAVDTVGNVSATGNSQPYTVTKDVGLVPNLGTSMLSAGGTNTSFVDAETQSVQSPDKVTVGFTQTIKQSYTDNTTAPPTTHNSSMCIASQNGNCLVANAATVASDGHSISMPVKTQLADGTYEVSVTTYSAGNCPDKTIINANGYKCDSYADLLKDPNTGLPFKFVVDSTKPTIAITSYTHPVTKANQTSASVSGTVSKTASSVQLLIKSSGSSTQHLFTTATIVQPSSPSDTNATWSASGLNLSQLPDGTLTIKATAKKSNGTSASATVHVQKKAHASLLSAHANKRTVTAGHPLKISGKLTDGAGNPITGENVAVKPKFASGHFGKAINGITDGFGHYTVTVHPRHNATYYAIYGGSTTQDSTRAHARPTAVRFAVKITSPKSGASASSPVTVSGVVKPSHAGARVFFYRHTASGNVLIGHAKLNKKSRFTASLSLPAGRDKIFAAVKKTKTNAAGKSGVLTLHVS